MLREVSIGAIMLAFGIGECNPDEPPPGGGEAGAVGVGGSGAEGPGSGAEGPGSGAEGPGTCTGWVTTEEWTAIIPEWPAGDLIGCEPTTTAEEVVNCVSRDQVQLYCDFCGGHIPSYADLDPVDLQELGVTVFIDPDTSSTGCGDSNSSEAVCPDLSNGPSDFSDIGAFCQPNP